MARATGALKAAAMSSANRAAISTPPASATPLTTSLDRGFRGLAKTRQHWHAPIGDRRTIDQLSDGQRAFNRLQAGLRALVEPSIGHLANAWALRRWRGLLPESGTSSAPPEH